MCCISGFPRRHSYMVQVAVNHVSAANMFLSELVLVFQWAAQRSEAFTIFSEDSSANIEQLKFKKVAVFM